VPAGNTTDTKNHACRLQNTGEIASSVIAQGAIAVKTSHATGILITWPKTWHVIGRG